MKKQKKLIDEKNKQNASDTFSPEVEKAAELNENVQDQVNKDKEQEEINEIDKIKMEYEQQLMEWKDKYLRLSAEFDNYRKRTLKEKMELTKYAHEEVLKGILPIVDDFERGLKNLEQTNNIEAVKDGIILIYNKFKDFLNQNGVREIESQNNEFNVDFHEAVTKIPVEDKSLTGKIVDVIQKGYYL